MPGFREQRNDLMQAASDSGSLSAQNTPFCILCAVWSIEPLKKHIKKAIQLHVLPFLVLLFVVCMRFGV